VPGRPGLSSSRQLCPASGVEGQGNAVPAAYHEPGTRPARDAAVRNPVPLRLTGCGKFGKSVVLGHATVAATSETDTAGTTPRSQAGELITRRFLATGAGTASPTNPGRPMFTAPFTGLSPTMPSTDPGRRRRPLNLQVRGLRQWWAILGSNQ
jgi:hypothetical protein